MLIVTDGFDVNMLTESCDVEFKALSLATAKQLLKAVPYEVQWQDADLSHNYIEALCAELGIEGGHADEEPVRIYYDTTLLVVDAGYDRGCVTNFRIWLVTPIKFT